MFPSNDSATRHSLPSPGFPRFQFPGFLGTMECSDVLRPSPRTRLPSPGDTMRRDLSFRSQRSSRSTAGQGFVSRSPVPAGFAWRRSGPPRFLGNPGAPLPCSPTPAGPTRQAIPTSSARPPQRPRRRLPRLFDLTRLDSTALELAVYASCGRLPGPHATLASGWWPTLPGGIGYPQGSMKGFGVVSLHCFPLSQALACAKTQLD